MAGIPDGCRRADPGLDWPLYVEAGQPLGSELSDILPLTDDAAGALWTLMVGADQPNYRQLPAGHRLARHTKYGPDWYTYANDPALPDDVARFLRESLPWPDGQLIFYAHSRRCIYRMSWQVLLRHWRRFMVIDESWVFAQGRAEFVLFADSGGLAVGDTGPVAEPPGSAAVSQ